MYFLIFNSCEVLFFSIYQNVLESILIQNSTSNVFGQHKQILAGYSLRCFFHILVSKEHRCGLTKALKSDHKRSLGNTL